MGFPMDDVITVALACLPIFVTGYMITRWEGALFVGYYAAYTTYVILASVQHDAQPHFSASMLAFVLSMAAAAQTRRARDRRGHGRRPAPLAPIGCSGVLGSF